MEMHPSGSNLDKRRRLERAKISGEGQRFAFGDWKDRPRAEAVAALHAITRDPVLYGLALGGALAQLEEYPQWGPALVELYRACGADEDVAARNLEWQRERSDYSRPEWWPAT
jgi:hypothetical protein